MTDRDPLADYREKRDFRRTPEPPPAAVQPRGGQVFVVHRHEARQLHYDLRLEHGGVLCSWAVPKGFSYDPAQKHLAVRTEDHPLAYEHFDGRIPKGQYGAGTMTLWDKGHYELKVFPTWEAALAKGELKLVLHGRRLRGEWHLVRTQQGPNTWLLFKTRDGFAGPDRDSVLGIDLGRAPLAPLPDFLEPMRWATPGAPFVDPTWLFEVEFAGRRSLLRKDGPLVTLPGQPAVDPGLAAAAASLRGHRALLDGVLVATDAQGRPDATATARALAGGDLQTLCYYAFDLLHWEDYDLRALPLLDRKAALRALLPAHPRLLFVDHVAGNGPGLLEAIAARGLPAMVGKRGASLYQSGPSDDWRRIAVADAPATYQDRAEPAPERTPTPTAWQQVRPSNLTKVYWPGAGHTKGDLLAYYATVAEWLLPHLRDRPLHLQRFPDGIDGKSFYQRDAGPQAPAWLSTTPIEHDGALVPHLVVGDLPTLLHAINLGSIDLHPWLSRVGHLDQPDYAVLDLDPKEAPFAWVVRLARAAGRLLRGIGLRPLLKTSGKRGMHVFVPLQPGYGYEHSRMFTEAVARCLVRELPELATIERAPERREGKVYLDFLQNRRSQTIVPPYAVRPVAAASVSAPLHWDELEDDGLDPARFTLQTMPTRLQQHGDLFRPALEDGQDLAPAIDALAQLLRGR
ncbi:MAG: non-homologous end-joining DNA ligase [Planctomycetes bacterium]|nr:non-homologous end-joining DNA ligase [Planctomycetota bacterium]